MLHSFADRGQWKMSRIVFESLSEDKKDKFINHGNSKAVDFGDEEFDFLDIIEANDSTTFMLKDTLKTREVEVNAKTFFRTPEGELSVRRDVTTSSYHPSTFQCSVAHNVLLTDVRGSLAE